MGAQNTVHGIETCNLQWAMDTDLLSWAQMWLFSKLVSDWAAEKHFHINTKRKEQCVHDFVPDKFLFLPDTLGLGSTKVTKCLLIFVRISEIRLRDSCIVDQKAHNNCDLGYCHDTPISLNENHKFCKTYCHHYFSSIILSFFFSCHTDL